MPEGLYASGAVGYIEVLDAEPVATQQTILDLYSRQVSAESNLFYALVAVGRGNAKFI